MRKGVGAGLHWGAAAVLPTTVLGSWGADLRLFPVAALLSELVIGPAANPSRERLLGAIEIALFGLCSVVASQLWREQSILTESRLSLLDHVPRGSRMGFIQVKKSCGTPRRLTPDRKLGAYAVTRRDALTNTLFQIPGADNSVLHRPSDRRHWFDQSQDVGAICPGGGVNAPALTSRIAALARDGFGIIWVADNDRPVSVPVGWRVVYRRRNHVLLAAQPLRATRIAPNAMRNVPATRAPLTLSPSSNVPAAKVMMKPSPTKG